MTEESVGAPEAVGMGSGGAPVGDPTSGRACGGACVDPWWAAGYRFSVSSWSMGLPVRNPSGVASVALCALPCMRQQCQRGGLQGRVSQVPLRTSMVPAWTIRTRERRLIDLGVGVGGAGRYYLFSHNFKARRGHTAALANFSIFCFVYFCTDS